MIFFLNIFALICFFSNLATAYVLGYLVLQGKIPVYLSRKILHIVFFFMPFAISRTVDRTLLASFSLSLAFLAILKLILYMDPVRKRVRFFRYCFAALERPEERPYSLHLLFIQKATYILILHTGHLLNPKFMHPREFHSIAYLTLTFGDGLAEIVGRTVKSYKYKVFSLFPTRENFRTLAGSSCVYLAAFILIIIFYPKHAPEFYYQLLIVPFVATALEAISPKAVDAPILFFGTFYCLHLVRNFV